MLILIFSIKLYEESFELYLKYDEVGPDLNIMISAYGVLVTGYSKRNLKIRTGCNKHN